MSKIIKDSRIGQIWLWVSVAERMKNRELKKPNPEPDVLLPYGYMYENDSELEDVAKSEHIVALLPNCDLVIGPFFTTGSKEENQILGNEKNEFSRDMLYLKKAMMHGTIDYNLNFGKET